MRKEQSTNFINEQYLFTACELNTALALISGRWKTQILLSIYHGNNRFNLLYKNLKNISEQVLGRQLKALEKDGIIIKNIIPGTTPTGIEYTLSDNGLKLLPILNELCLWGRQYVNRTNIN